MTSAALDIWTVYEHPRDYPQGYVMRRWSVTDDGPVMTPQVVYTATLEDMRRYVPMGLIRLPRQPGDDPCILETWI
jgi:hypothetical protein